MGINGKRGLKTQPLQGSTFRTRTVPDGRLRAHRRPATACGHQRKCPETVPPEGRSASAGRPLAPTFGTAGNTATKDTELEVIGDPDRPQSED